MALSGGGDECDFHGAATLDSGAIVPVLRVKRIAFQGIARKIFAIAAKCFALRDSARCDVAVAVERFALCRDASAALTGLLIIAKTTIQSAIGCNNRFMHTNSLLFA